ncbi:hypothetical protein MUB24_03345 [Lederbergia sp. NSJ-179]|uniref:hypothetical protein n=1 Tax=Lederbergia sp. NSJ-179 TaxID=2931402 RepID=UPI001FD1602A|nr:hypothetical protein [Lederbergia sp. NSJ-179]MCJ7839962.1 hypothetical protein [Lederbergia sp. NSJ-179]
MNYITDLPYGIRVFENGRVELFNRNYEIIRTVNPFEKEKIGVSFYEVWFYDDSTSPIKNQQSDTFVRELLERWDRSPTAHVERWREL